MNTLRLDILKNVFVLHLLMLASLARYRTLNCLEILKALFIFSCDGSVVICCPGWTFILVLFQSEKACLPAWGIFSVYACDFLISVFSFFLEFLFFQKLYLLYWSFNCPVITALHLYFALFSEQFFLSFILQSCY